MEHLDKVFEICETLVYLTPTSDTGHSMNTSGVFLTLKP